MIKITFILRLILLLIAGLFLISAFKKMAKRGPYVQSGRRKLWLKILGCFLALLGVACGLAGLYWVTQIDYPQTPIEPLLSVNPIVRPSSQTLYWGYPTLLQQFCISFITNGFVLLSLASYCIYFRSSATVWWKKILKVVFGIIMLLVFMSSTDFHYFDFTEWIAPFIYAIMLYFVMKSSDDNDLDWDDNQETEDNTQETSPIVEDNKEDESRFMPLNNVAMDEEEMQTTQETNDIKIEESVPLTQIEESNSDIEKDVNEMGNDIDNNVSTTTLTEKVRGLLAHVKSKICSVFQSKQVDDIDENVDDSVTAIWKYHVSKPTKIILIVVMLLTLVDLFFFCDEWRMLEFYSDHTFRANIIILVIELITLLFILVLYKVSVRRKRWYYTVLKGFCLILFVLSSVSGVYEQIDNYGDYKEAKEFYKTAQILRSDDTEQKERLFEEDVESGHMTLPDEGSELVDTMQSMAYKDNPLAQGTLAKIYFSRAENKYISEYDREDRINDLKEKRSYLNRGFYWAMKAAEKGDKRGAYYAGLCYAGICEELEIKKDFKLAAKYWNIAAEKGYGMAYYRLGQLYGTWELFDGVVITASGEIYACDVDHEDNSIIERYSLPDDWKHDLKKARQYWHKALRYGGDAAEQAKMAIEKVYDEEVSSNKMKE